MPLQEHNITRQPDAEAVIEAVKRAPGTFNLLSVFVFDKVNALAWDNDLEAVFERFADIVSADFA